MSDSTDTVVVGAGVVGLAIARELALAGREVVLLERHAEIGTETSARNSEVIHAGLYYPTGSLKARFCVEGREALYRFCELRGIAHRRCGKLIVASGPEQERKLAAIAAQAARNGVEIEPLSAAEAAALEPEVRCTAALHSPHTGLIDSHAYMLALLADFEAAGGLFARRASVRGARVGDRGLVVEVASARASAGACETLVVRGLVNSAGLSAPAIAAAIEGLAPRHVPRAFYAKGNYFSCSGRPPFSRLVYPMPNEAGLGIHATLDLAGRVKFGPDVQWVETPEYGIDETRAGAFYAAIREYWPGLEDGRLTPAYAGIRPKIVGPDAPAADFMIAGSESHGVEGLVNLFGIESPGLTASLGIARYVRALLEG